jgi:hypothetical protein
MLITLCGFFKSEMYKMEEGSVGGDQRKCTGKDSLALVYCSLPDTNLGGMLFNYKTFFLFLYFYEALYSFNRMDSKGRLLYKK